MSAKELMFSNCGAREDSWESLGQQEDQTSKSLKKSALNVHWKDWRWSSNTLATWCKEPALWKIESWVWCLRPLGHPDMTLSQLFGRDPDTGKDWGQEEKGMTEDEMFGWHHWLNRCESEQIPGGSKGKRSLACCSRWCRIESEMTQRLNNNNNIQYIWTTATYSTVQWSTYTEAQPLTLKCFFLAASCSFT